MGVIGEPRKEEYVEPLELPEPLRQLPTPPKTAPIEQPEEVPA